MLYWTLQAAELVPAGHRHSFACLCVNQHISNVIFKVPPDQRKTPRKRHASFGHHKKNDSFWKGLTWTLSAKDHWRPAAKAALSISHALRATSTSAEHLLMHTG